jgi:UrcA family protein
MKALLFLPLLLAAPATAQTSVTVNYRDLDLARPAAVAALDARLVSAARRACRPVDSKDLHAIIARRTCMATALESARTAARTAARNATATAQARAAGLPTGS